jgi:hypothetical protein
MYSQSFNGRMFLTTLALALTGVAVGQAAIINTPGLTGVRFWEGTGPIVPFTFVQNGPEMSNQIGALLGPGNEDFSQIPNENYDVFYSDANGNFNLNGNHVTVECVYPVPNGGGGLNLAAVDLVFGSGTLRADVLSSWVGLGPNYAPASVVLAVDADTAVPTTLTTMGSTMIPPLQHLRVTVTWSHLQVPEPGTGLLALSSLASLLLRRRSLATK